MLSNMRIKKITHEIIQLPLIHELSHARKKFKKSESLFFLVELDGVFGVGECAPRPYVSGETIASAAFLFEDFLKKKITGFSFRTIEEFDYYLDELISGNLALKAGIEIAVLDALGKIKNLPIYKLIFKKAARRIFQINGGVPFLASVKESLSLIQRFYEKGVRDFKLKVTKDLINNLFRVKYLRKEFPDIRIRIDANGCWSFDEALKNLSKIERYKVSIVEEPLVGGDLYLLKRLKEKINMQIMVDESLVNFSDAIALIELKACDWFNLRLSKNGGFLKTKNILELANQYEIKTQIGAHFGESDILEAAKRHFAFGAKHLDSFEGGTIMLLQEHITEPSLTYKDDLRAEIESIDKQGLGVDLKQKHLKSFI